MNAFVKYLTKIKNIAIFPVFNLGDKKENPTLSANTYKLVQKLTNKIPANKPAAAFSEMTTEQMRSAINSTNNVEKLQAYISDINKIKTGNPDMKLLLDNLRTKIQKKINPRNKNKRR
jgi:hypothetical protein